MMIKTCLGLACFGFLAGAVAQQVVPVTYDMPNGTSGTYTYWDDSYSGLGCKTCNGAQLTGGLGDLTDGVIATSNWFVTEAPAGPGPYVGWAYTDPSLVFHFGHSVAIDSVTFSFDDAQSGGVAAPASVVIGTQTYAVVNPPGTLPFNFTVAGLNFVGSDLPVTINRGSVVSFVSEVSFASASPVPEVGTATMMLVGGIGLLSLQGRLRRRIAARQ